jgi:hypothetical protein
LQWCLIPIVIFMDNFSLPGYLLVPCSYSPPTKERFISHWMYE